MYTRHNTHTQFVISPMRVCQSNDNEPTRKHHRREDFRRHLIAPPPPHPKNSSISQIRLTVIIKNTIHVHTKYSSSFFSLSRIHLCPISLSISSFSELGICVYQKQYQMCTSFLRSTWSNTCARASFSSMLVFWILWWMQSYQRTHTNTFSALKQIIVLISSFQSSSSSAASIVVNVLWGGTSFPKKCIILLFQNDFLCVCHSSKVCQWCCICRWSHFSHLLYLIRRKKVHHFEYIDWLNGWLLSVWSNKRKIYGII